MAGAKKRIEHDEVVRRFAARLRQVRTGRGMTQAELAAYLLPTSRRLRTLSEVLTGLRVSSSRGCHGRLVCFYVLPRLGSKTFADADLGDARRTRRLIASAAAIAAHPEKPFTQLFDWGQLKGFYRLCDQETATVTAIQTPHWDQTRRAVGQHPTVLVLHDTTELDFATHPALDGAGPIGNGLGRGFLQHNSLAVVPDPRRVLGLAHQQLELRRDAPDRETASQRRERERESKLWVRGIEASGRPPAGSRWVDVGDRGADFYEAMIASQKWGHDFPYRVAQDRQCGGTNRGKRL